MGEVFHFNECIISGTDGTPIAPFAEEVSVDLTRQLFDVKNESGQIIKRFESGKNAAMTIRVLFAEDVVHTDGQALNLHYGNALGTTSYQLGSAYVTETGWQQSQKNQAVRHDVKLVGRTFGTIS